MAYSPRPSSPRPGRTNPGSPYPGRPPAPTLDLRPDGSFAPRNPRRPGPAIPWPVRIGLIAGMLALGAAAIAGAALALWVALMLLPVIAVALVVAWIAFRVQIWRVQRSRR